MKTVAVISKGITLSYKQSSSEVVLKGLQSVAELGGTDDADPETEIQSLRKKLEEKLSQNRASRDAEKASAEGKRNRALAENDKDLEQKVRDYDAAHEGDLQNLTETQQKALDFAKEELSYIKERYEKIRKSMDHTEVEKDKYDQIYERCTAQIEAYMDEYEPDLAEWQDVIDEINGRHMPGIEDKRGEYDFELNRYESFFVDRNIPVFRLETDYKYQDIEQIRIRVEAFKEMLIQNLYRQERCN